MTADEVALLVMAGGRSQRFGEEDKLLAELHGMPLGLHVIHSLAGFDFATRLAVASGVLASLLAERSYNIIPAVAGGGIGDNMAQGVKALGDVKAVLVVLADMPFVSHAHFQRLLAAATGSRSLIASACEGHISPPVLFGQAYFADLTALSGDAGARGVLMNKRSHLTRIEGSPAELLDIDTSCDLVAANRAQI